MGTTASRRTNKKVMEAQYSGCMTLSEVARIVKPAVSRAAVFRWIQTGKLRAFKGKSTSRYLITFTDLKQFASQHGKHCAEPQLKY